MKRTISARVGRGSVNHNTRKFHAKNTDPERSHLNITYCEENIKAVYHELFDEQLQVCQLHIGSTCPELLQLNTRRPHSGTPSRESEKGLLLFFCPK